MRLDSFESYPSGMKEYLSAYGWHFSKKMCDWAVSRMYKKSDKGDKISITAITRDKLDLIIKSFGINIDNCKGYDYVYVANMCKADFLGSSIEDDRKMILFVKDYIDDPDAYEGMPFTRFYADCIGSGTPIMWEDML